MRRVRILAIIILIPLVMATAACSDIPLSPGPGRDVSKETGPLTRPPPSVLNGTAR